MRKEKGITLIALVITIVVLLILAGVSISMVTGKNGVLNQAQNAATETQNASEKEKMTMAIAAAQMAGDGILTTDNLYAELRKVNDRGILTGSPETGWSFQISGKEFYSIDNLGNFAKEEKLVIENYQRVEYIESTGTQYIITDDIVTDVDKVWAELSFSQVGDSFVCGNPNNYGSTGNYNHIFISLSYGAKFQYKYTKGGPWKASGVVPTRDKRYIIESYLTQGRQYLKVDDILQVEGTETFTDTFADKFQIFKSNTNWGAKIRLYNMVLEKNGVRKRNLIPCYSTAEVANSMGEICPIGTKGLYDLVEDKFYTNRSPSGDDFTAGPIVE